MRRVSLVAVVAAAALALALAGCATGSPAQSAQSAGSAQPEPVEQISAGVVKFNLDGAGDALEARVTVNGGETYATASKLESGEAEIVLHGPEGDSSDYAYDGYGVGTMGVPAGTYGITVKPADASGTIYVLSYPTGQLDVEHAETEDLFAQVEEFAANAG